MQENEMKDFVKIFNDDTCSCNYLEHTCNQYEKHRFNIK